MTSTIIIDSWSSWNADVDLAGRPTGIQREVALDERRVHLARAAHGEEDRDREDERQHQHARTDDARDSGEPVADRRMRRVVIAVVIVLVPMTRRAAP